MNLTIGEVLQKTTAYFQNKGIPSARLDAELLLADILGLDRVGLYTNYDRPLNNEELGAYRQSIARRGNREPLAYITGHKEFYGLDLYVNTAVLVPRPETEILVQGILDLLPTFGTGNPSNIVEIGVGSGAISIALGANCPACNIWASDISPPALELAGENVDKHGLTKKIKLVLGPYFSALPAEIMGKVTVVVSNPPYLTRAELSDAQPEVQKEPRVALDGGVDGLEAYRQIVTEAPTWLIPGGLLALEIGSTQAGDLIELIAKTRAFGPPEIRTDYAGHDRVVMAFLNKG